MRPLYPNHIWSVDFVQDRLIRVPLWSTLKAGGSSIIEVITIGFHMYYGSEFKARLLQEWLRTIEVEPIYIYPGSPWENGYNERFNGTLRHEVLDPEVFYSLDEAQSVIAQWVHQYNHTRPHQSLNNRPPVPETIVPSLSHNLVHTQGA